MVVLKEEGRSVSWAALGVLPAPLRPYTVLPAPLPGRSVSWARLGVLPTFATPLHGFGSQAFLEGAADVDHPRAQIWIVGGGGATGDQGFDFIWRKLALAGLHDEGSQPTNHRR